MGRKNKTVALESPRYRRFISDRDRALEVLLNNAREEMHDVLRGTFAAIKEQVAMKFATLATISSATDTSGFMADIDRLIEQQFSQAINQIGGIFLRLRVTSYTLALTGECEAIGQAKDERVNVQLSKNDVMEYAVRDAKKLGAEIKLDFDELRRKLLNPIQLSRMEGSTPAEVLERIDRALPSGRWVARRNRTLRPLKEAATLPEGQPASMALQIKQGKLDIAEGFIDDEMWDSMVADYLKEFVPTYQFRRPGSVAKSANYQYDTFKLEKRMTNDFVKTVRDAAAEGSAINGIKEFQWIVVIDHDTCDSCCGDYGCADFDGKTDREVEKMTKGEVALPPAHYNCRCTFAPLLEYMPELPEFDAKDFDEWLNT